MHIKTRLATAVLALFTITPHAFADETLEETRHSLVAFNELFNEFAASHDIEGLVSLYDRDAYWIAPDALPTRGRDGVPRQTITFMSENKADLSHTVEDLFISDDGTQAVMMGVTSASVESADIQFEGTYVYVLQRSAEDEPWRVVLDMFNNHPTD